MKVSVIIPIKNRAHLIQETLDSILGQTVKPAEIILVDDGSTDNLKDVLLTYQDKVIVVENIGKGPGAARNTGLKYATGEAIQFFDSDDIMSSNKIEVQLKLLSANESAKCVIGPFVAAQKSNDGWVQTNVVMQHFPLPSKPLYDIVAEGWCSITQACLFSKKLVDQVGPWREDVMTHEDKDFWFRVALLDPFPLQENNSLTIYRQHEQQITDKFTQEIERTKNGITVFSDILKMNKNKLSVLSKWVLKGLIANYKMYCARYNVYYKVNLTDKIAGLISKAYYKYGRVKTKSSWQPMHGINKEPINWKLYNFK